MKEKQTDKQAFTVDELMKELKPIAEELNKESDSMTQMLRNFEKDLNNLNLQVEAWVKGDITYEWFGYGYYEGRYGLLVRSSRSDESLKYNRKWLLSSSRLDRIQALPLLPQLVAQLQIRADETLEAYKEKRGKGQR